MYALLALSLLPTRRWIVITIILGAAGGLMVSVVFKYAGNIQKSFAGTLCSISSSFVAGPGLALHHMHPTDLLDFVNFASSHIASHPIPAHPSLAHPI